MSADGHVYRLLTLSGYQPTENALGMTSGPAGCLDILGHPRSTEH
jgi:hypothetical protein